MSLKTPSSIFAPKYQSWTPTTPTPCSALRPSLSLHNLASKTFTEVLVPSIHPPDTLQVTPPHSASKRSPLLISPSPRTPKKISVVIFGEANLSQFTSEQISNNYNSPKPDESIDRSGNHQHSPSASQNIGSYRSLPSLSEISENMTFMECKKEISVWGLFCV